MRGDERGATGRGAVGGISAVDYFGIGRDVRRPCDGGISCGGVLVAIEEIAGALFCTLTAIDEVAYLPLP